MLFPRSEDFTSAFLHLEKPHGCVLFLLPARRSRIDNCLHGIRSDSCHQYRGLSQDGQQPGPATGGQFSDVENERAACLDTQPLQILMIPTSYDSCLKGLRWIVRAWRARKSWRRGACGGLRRGIKTDPCGGERRGPTRKETYIAPHKV